MKQTLGIVVGLLLSLHGTHLSQAESNTQIETVAPVTVIANRGETELSKVGNAVTILDAKTLNEEGIHHLDDMLKFVPGVISESLSGQRGSSSSLFLRGTVTGQTHVRVDGVRITGPNISTGNFLGGSGSSGLSTIEILRGPQSALYGGDAIGGVVGLYSKRGSGDPSGRLHLEGGSFDSRSATLDLQGQIDQFSYALSIGHEATDNDLPNNGFEQLAYALRLDYELNHKLNIGLTLRAFDSELRRPDYAASSFGRDGDDETDSFLGTLFANLQVNEAWNSKLTFGFYDEEYQADTLASPNFYDTSGTKHSVYWDNNIQWNDRHITTAGVVFEETDYSYASEYFGLSADRRENIQYGSYANHSWDATENLTLNGGIRWEDYDSYGDETTWRTSAAYRISQTNTKIRASVGKGFRPPSFTELYGFGGGSNFDLQAEESLGWDVGIDQEFCDGNYELSISYFQNDIKDRIKVIYDPMTFAATSINISGTTHTSGAEIAARGHWLQQRLHATLSYTWLNEALSGQPKHSGGLRVHGNITPQLDAGFSINYLDERSWGGDLLDSYVLTNLHASYELNPSVTLNARIENLFDKSYEYASFGGTAYPGRGRGLFAGATIMW